MLHRLPRLRALAAEQEHAVSRSQLRAAGVDDQAVRAHLAAGR